MKKLTKKAANQIITAKLIRPGKWNYGFSNQACTNLGLSQEEFELTREAWNNAPLNALKATIVDAVIRAYNSLQN